VDDISFVWAGWEPVARILLVGTVGYVWLVFLLSSSGPRNLATMTPFDFAITVTLGSAFGRVLTATEVSLTDAAVAFALLIGLQWLFAGWRVRWPAFRRLTDVRPTLLYADGRIIKEGLRRHRLTESDLHAAAREQGLGSLRDVGAVILQSNGTFSVVKRDEMGDRSSIDPYTRPVGG
jgi:uncharacterized membrane protein YcaP (DUF421 family)